MIFLVSPYTHQNPAKRKRRFVAACEAAAVLMRVMEHDARERGKPHQIPAIYCPIAHSHPIAEYGGIDPNDGPFWQDQNREMLANASGLLVLMLDGWRESRGVQHEIAEARANNIPIRWMTSQYRMLPLSDEPQEGP